MYVEQFKDLLRHQTPKKIAGFFVEGMQVSLYSSYSHTAPQSKTAVCAFQITYNLLPFTLEDFLNKLSDDQCSSITKGSFYHIKHMTIQPFTMGVD